MSETTLTIANDAGSARGGGRGLGHGMGRTCGGRNSCGRGRDAGRHNQNKCRTMNMFKGNTDDMKDKFFQCYR